MRSRYFSHSTGCFCKNVIKLNPWTNISKAYSSQALSSKSSHIQSSFGPSVRLLLTLYDISPEKVGATGPHERLLKGDVLNYININKLEPKPYEDVPGPPTQQSDVTDHVISPQPPPPLKQIVLEDNEDFTDMVLTSMRKTIAKRLTLSKTTIPHIYSTADCNTSKLNQTRRELAEEGIKVTVNDLIVKACAVVLQRMPAVNSRLVEGQIQELSTVDVAVAVAMDDGLITPVVAEANEKSVHDISSTIRELAERAREGRLQPHEFQGGSMTISNLGMFGVKEFKAVINPPQSSILAVGTTQMCVSEEGKPYPIVNISLACDGRVIDEITASKFVSSLKEFIENPSMIGL